MPDLLIRWSVRLALAAYAVRLAADLRCYGTAVSWRTPVVRACWLLGALLLAAHVALAFHFVHHWSHAHAYAETARRSAALTGLNWGGGVWLNELTVLLWCGDAGWMLLSPDSYARRPTMIGGMLHGWLNFMAINGAVVFEQAGTRWWALAVYAIIGVLTVRQYFWELPNRG